MNYVKKGKTKPYSKDFKESAIKLMNERGNILSVARDLGVSYSLLLKWRKDFCN